MKQLFISCIFGVLIFINPSWADNIILDLDGVIFRTDRSECLKHMQVSNIINAMITLKQSPLTINTHLYTKLFETLQKTALLHSFEYDTSRCAFDENQNMYPSLMCAWLDGAMTNEKIRVVVLSSIEQHPEWFAHEIEQDIIASLVDMIFTPEHFIGTRKLHRRALRFIKSQKALGHKIYILSNWDAESFDLLVAKYPKVFKHVDGMVISGNDKNLKPSLHIYKSLVRNYELDPEKSWFFDDQQENIDAACDLRINGVLCEHSRIRNKPNFREIKKRINKE